MLKTLTETFKLRTFFLIRAFGCFKTNNLSANTQTEREGDKVQKDKIRNYFLTKSHQFFNRVGACPPIFDHEHALPYLITSMPSHI